MGVLIHNRINKYFNCELLHAEYEGIMWVKFTARCDGSTPLLLCACYLPPETSTRRRDAAEFLDTLLGQVYEYQNHGLVFIGGDFNGRCGDLSEYIEGVDDIPDREVIDSVDNSQGNSLVDFMISANLCMLNGRHGTNNFTCISHKGRSAVDYCFVPYEQLGFYNNFQVITMTDAVEQYSLSVPDRLPDHSLLTATIVLSKWADIPAPDGQSVELQSEPDSDADSGPRYVVKDLPQSFLNDANSLQQVQSAVERIEESLVVQGGVDSAYDELCKLLYNEMDQKLKRIPSYNKNIHSNNKLKQKPWWNDDLNNLWRVLSLKERCYLKCKDNEPRKRRSKREWLSYRKYFDIAHRRSKRRYQKQQQNELLQAHQQIQQDFWRQLGKTGIGQERKPQLPNCVRIGDVINTDAEAILNKGKRDFAELFSEQSNSFDDNHLIFVKNRLHEIEEVSSMVNHVIDEPNLTVYRSNHNERN